MPNLSIKQIAEMLGVPKIKVYKYIKSNHIEETLSERSTLFYNEQAVDRIVSAFREEENTLGTLRNAPQNSLETVLETLSEQLRVKDEQLSAKDKQIEQLTAALTAAQETQQQLTSSLIAAQALHAGTLQNQIEEKPLGFWKRLRKK